MCLVKNGSSVCLGDDGLKELIIICDCGYFFHKNEWTEDCFLSPKGAGPKRNPCDTDAGNVSGRSHFILTVSGGVYGQSPLSEVGGVYGLDPGYSRPKIYQSLFCDKVSPNTHITCYVTVHTWRHSSEGYWCENKRIEVPQCIAVK